MNVLVLGAGAIGSVLGARLAGPGREVLLVGRPEHVAAIEAGGLRVEGTGGGTFRLRAASTVPPEPTFHAFLVATKTFDLEPALEALGRAQAPAPTLLVQNGLGIEPKAREALRRAGWSEPGRWVVRCVQSIPATFLGPGRVRAAGHGELVLPEPEYAGEANGAARFLVDLLHDAGLEVRTTSHLAREIWKKVLVNAAINPVTALHGVPNGELLQGPLREEAVALLEEARSVAERSGAAFSPSEALGEFERVVRATATNRSSMLQDVERGRPTEVDAILGEVLRRGERLGLRLPATQAALRSVLGRASRAPGPAQPL